MKEYPFPHPTLGITVHYMDGVPDGLNIENPRVEYHLTEAQYLALPYPDNVNTWKANKAAELGMTLEEYDAAVQREVIQAPFSCKGMKMEAEYQRLKGEFRAHSGGRIARKECTVEELDEFLESNEAQAVFRRLRALNFAGAITKIQAMEHPLATDEFKTYWVAKIQGAM